MILSMTGYGSGTCQAEGTTVATEVRTVNHRFLDLHVRVPREYSVLESEIQRTVRDTLTRGRVDITVTIQVCAPPEILLNTGAARAYIDAVEKLRIELGLQGALDLKTLLSLPGVLQSRDQTQSPQENDADPIRSMVLQSLRQALENVLRMRQDEGRALQAELLVHLANIQEKVRLIEDYCPRAMLEWRNKLLERLAQVLPDNILDPQRVAQEVALVAEKSDIAEEVARLGSHLAQFSTLIAAGKEAGKKMDFLLQEMQRECNTVLSKSGSLEITREGLAIKADIEKLREQVQNIE